LNLTVGLKMDASITATCPYPEAARNHWEIRNLRVCVNFFC